MKIETQSPIEKIPELQSFELRIPEFKDKLPIEGEKFKVMFNRQVLEGDIISEVKKNDLIINVLVKPIKKKIAPEISKVKIMQFTPERVAMIKITFNNAGGQFYTADTIVNNPFRELKALGRTLWESSLPLMQKFADKFDATVVHEVMRQPSEGLDRDKWDKLFLPLLGKYGYRQKEEPLSYLWEKTYPPSKNKL